VRAELAATGTDTRPAVTTALALLLLGAALLAATRRTARPGRGQHQENPGAAARFARSARER
jgi:LPXTG-motif cell wall-anchored protein